MAEADREARFPEGGEIMDKTLIHIEALVKTYKMGDSIVNALDHVSMTVEHGEFVAIAGPSGSGKSTLMNMIGCLDQPDSGEYSLEGQSVGKLRGNQLASIRNKKIGFIFQNFNLLARLTAYENVELPLVYQGIKAKARRHMVIDALEKVGLSDRSGHLPNQLSGGQQQRVAIARALVGSPPILLADEPTGALDSKTSKGIMETLENLNRAGHTIILITHDPSVAARTPRTIRISDGRLYEEEGATSEHIHFN